MGVELAIFIVCLFLSAFFSGSETALMSASRLRLQRMRDEGDSQAGRILKLVEMVVNRGVPFTQMLQLFSYILPGFLEVTLPKQSPRRKVEVKAE